MKIILLGAPGAGKDTLANQLLEEYNYTMISPGALFRSEAKAKTELGLIAKDKYWGKGILCPDELVNTLVSNKINILNKDDTSNILFNGYPRSVCQAEFIQSLIHIDMVIDLCVSENVAVGRLLERGRLDDTEDIIKERFNQYQEKTKPVSDFYKKVWSCRYILIDANRTIPEVYEEIISHTGI